MNLEPDSGARAKFGVVVSLLELHDGTTRIVLDDVICAGNERFLHEADRRVIEYPNTFGLVGMNRDDSVHDSLELPANAAVQRWPAARRPLALYLSPCAATAC